MWQRIKRARMAAGLTQADIAEHMNVSTAAVALWESADPQTRTTPRRTKINKLARYLGVSPQWLEFGDESYDSVTETGAAYNQKKSVRIPANFIKSWDEQSDLDPDVDIMIDKFDVKVSAGPGSINPEFIKRETQIPFQAYWLNKRNIRSTDAIILSVSGDSMAKYICDGDAVLVNRAQTDIEAGRVYAFLIGDELKIKYLSRRYDGGLIIKSENKSQPHTTDEIPPEGMQFIHIIGRVRWRGGDI
jgi:phage repressor protein C with HTH and peptisase S24 domain